jgi:hypothetical protein
MVTPTSASMAWMIWAASWRSRSGGTMSVKVRFAGPALAQQLLGLGHVSLLHGKLAL